MIVEDGTGRVDANSYVDIAYADDYFSTRGYTKWEDCTTAQKEMYLVKATDYINFAFKYHGVKATETQALNFPRKKLIDRDGYEVKGIPSCLKMAVCECVQVLVSGTDLFQTESSNGAVTSEKIGDLSFTYDVAQKIKDSSLYQSINSRLRGLYEDTSKATIYTGNVQRA